MDDITFVIIILAALLFLIFLSFLLIRSWIKFKSSSTPVSSI